MNSVFKYIFIYYEKRITSIKERHYPIIIIYTVECLLDDGYNLIQSYWFTNNLEWFIIWIDFNNLRINIDRVTNNRTTEFIDLIKLFRSENECE